MSIVPVRDGYEDLKPTGDFTGGGATNPTTSVFRGNHRLHAYAGGGANNIATFKFHFPHDYVEGSDIYFHVHWLNNQAAPTGNVKWKVTWSYSRGYEDGAFSADIVTTLPDANVNATQYTHHITESAVITQAMVAQTLRTDGIIIATLERDTADTNNDDAFLVEFDVHYLSDGRKTLNRNDTGSGFEKV